MENNGFTFEIIVPSITTKKECLDPRELTVDVNFHRIALTVSSSCMNLSEFPEKPGFDFYAALEELKYMISSMPILFIVKYGEEVIGLSETAWPQESLTHIHSAMDEIFHVGECDLNLEDKKVGCMEFIMRIRKKCDNFEKKLSALELNSNLRDLANREDILLMMANDPNFRCPGREHGHNNNAERHSDHRASGKERGSHNSETRAPCPDPRACEIAKLIEMMNQMGKPKNDCTFKPVECHDCDEGMFNTGSSDISSSDDDANSSPQHDQNKQSEKEKSCWFCPHDIPPPPDLTQIILRTPRHCLICKQNMAWLPKFSACPNCGYKPLPLPKEVPYNEKITANKIIEEYGMKATSCSETEESTNKICSYKKPSKIQKCRCRCNNKKCAFCLVQKLAEETMLTTKEKTPQDELKSGKCDGNTSNFLNTCKDNDENSRPFLARVFSELRLLYDVKPRAEPKKPPINEFCEKQIKAIFKKIESNRSEKHAEKGKTAEGSKQQNEQKQQLSQMPKDKYNQKQESNHKKHNGRKLKNRKLRIPSYGPHKKCFNGINSGKNVPKSMGWLWTADPRPKWRPGYIGKRIRRIMHYFLEIYPTTTPEAKRLAYEHCQKICEERKVIPPTLHVEKKQDAYYVTLNRHANPASLQECMEPCNENGKPITFKIIKHPKLILYRHLKRKLKDMGFSKCVCHRPISECICRSFLEKKHLEFAVKNECCKRKIPCVNNDLVLSNTSISEADFDFEVKPPAAVVKPSTRKQVKMVSTGTQYVPTDIVLTPPGAGQKEVGRFLATYDCTVGEKYGKPRFIPYPGQNIPGMEWRKAIREQKRAERAAKLANKKYKIGTVKEKFPKIVETPIPFGENGPPKIGKDGTALDENDKPLVDADGNAYMITRKMDGSLKIEKKKKKPLNMIKYLTNKGLLVAKDKGRNPRPIPPGGLNPEYLAMQRALRRQKYIELLEQTPLPVCMVDRLGKPCPNNFFEC